MGEGEGDAGGRGEWRDVNSRGEALRGNVIVELGHAAMLVEAVKGKETGEEFVGGDCGEEGGL